MLSWSAPMKNPWLLEPSVLVASGILRDGFGLFSRGLGRPFCSILVLDSLGAIQRHSEAAG
jgi:hypothetical protein